MNNWFWYENMGIKEFKIIEDFPENSFGFIYKITNIVTGKFYIGKKSLYHNVKKKLTKKELAEQSGPGRKATTKRIQKESDWVTYWGSNKEILVITLSIDSREFTDLLEENLQTLIDFEEYETCALAVKLQNKMNKQKV